MRVVLLSRSPALAEEVARLAAAAGVTIQQRPPEEALALWAGEGLLVVGADAASEAAALGAPRREGVVLVVLGEAGAADFRAAVQLGAMGVVELPASQDWFVALLTDSGEPPARGRSVGVLGGVGGSGASTFACALGQTGARLGDTIVLDLDPWGPGVERMLGLELADGVRWGDLARAPGRLSARALREAVPRRGHLGVLGWGPVTPPLDLGLSLAREIFGCARRGNDLVVLDLGRAAGAVALDLAHRCDLLVVLAPATVLGLAATARLVEGLGAAGERAVLALRPGPLLPDQAEDLTGRPVVTVVRRQRGLDEALDLGLGPARSARTPTARAARDVLEMQ